MAKKKHPAFYQHFKDAMINGGPDSYELSSDGVRCGRFCVQPEDIALFPELEGVEQVLIWNGGIETIPSVTLNAVIPQQLREVIPYDYQEALLAYAQAKGKNWNEKLREDFYTGRDDRFPQYGPMLRQIRNHPVWHKAVYTEELDEPEAQHEIPSAPPMRG